MSLASCVKSIESQSVTDVRKARAEEILSQAELNKANAQAAVTLANAEATLAAAQAELAKANALIAQAEAKKIEAEAELVKIDAQLKTVQVEQEKVQLQIKQAELQKALAEADQAIARAELTKQRIANQLALMAQELEIAKSENAKALLEAQIALEKAIKDQEEAERAALQEIANKYIAFSDQLMTLQMQYNAILLEITEVEARIKTPEEVWAKEIAEKRAELARVEMKIAAIQKYAKVSPEEVEAYLDAARIALMDAENVYQDAVKDMNAKLEAYNAIVNTTPEYTQNWYKFQNIVYSSGLHATNYNDETDIWEEGFFDANGEFVALWNYDDTKFEYVSYPEPKDGIVPPSTIWLVERTIIPAKVNSANFELLFAQLVTEKEEEIADYTKTVEENLANDKEYYEGRIKYYEDRVAAYQEYVDAVEPKVNAAEAVVEEKIAALEEATKARNAALQVAQNYVKGASADGELNQAWTEYNKAYNAKNEADNAVIDAENNLNWAKSWVETWTNNKYDADMEVATKTNDVNVAKKAITDEIVKAVSDAEAALAKQHEVVEKAKKAVDDAVTALRAANIKLAADPTNEELKATQAAAATKKTEAEDKYDEENGKLPALQTAVTTAQDAFDAVNNPYQTALAELETAEAQAAYCDEQLTYYQNKVTEYEEALAAAKQAAEEAAAAYEAAEAALKAAQDAQVDATEEGNALWQAFWDADNACNNAQNALTDAQNDLQTVKNNYYNYDYYVTRLDPEVEYSDAWRLNYYKELLENADINAAEQIAAKEAELVDLQEAIEEVKADLAKIDAAEPAYIKLVESANAAWAAYNEAQKVAFDAEMARDAAKAEVEGMASQYYFWDEDGNLQVADVYAALEALNEQKAELEEEIDYYLKEWPVGGAAYVEMLKVESDKLLLRIEVLTKIVAEYEAILAEAFGANFAA